jgi:hypothetical protein
MTLSIGIGRSGTAAGLNPRLGAVPGHPRLPSNQKYNLRFMERIQVEGEDGEEGLKRDLRIESILRRCQACASVNI